MHFVFSAELCHIVSISITQSKLCLEFCFETDLLQNSVEMTDFSFVSVHQNSIGILFSHYNVNSDIILLIFFFDYYF